MFPQVVHLLKLRTKSFPTGDSVFPMKYVAVINTSFLDNGFRKTKPLYEAKTLSAYTLQRHPTHVRETRQYAAFKMQKRKIYLREQMHEKLFQSRFKKSKKLDVYTTLRGFWTKSEYKK